MTKTSKFGYYVTPYSVMPADYPMSAATARWYLNNARHLIDQSTQFRVNWVALSTAYVSPATGVEGVVWDGSGSTWVHVQSHHFPVSLIGRDTYNRSYRSPAHLVVSIAGYTESADELFFRAVIQPSNTSLSGDFVDDSVLAYWEDSTTSNTSEWILDGVTTALYPSDLIGRLGPQRFDMSEHDGNNYDVEMYMLRLSIYAKEGYASGEGHLTGVCVREYQA